MSNPRFSERDRKMVGKFLKDKFPTGFLDTKTVLDLARPRNSPIHKYFNWDDSKAAELYRLEQARKLIACVVVEIKGREVRGYTQPVVVNEEGDKRYVDINIARNNQDIWAQVLERAIKDLNYWKERYSNLKELSLVFKAIDKINQKHVRSKQS